MMRHFSIVCASLLGVLLFLSPGAATEKASFPRRNPVVEAIQKTQHGIVSVRVPRPNGGRDMIGTGVIVDERGFIVTNRHVVGASRQVNIRLYDGSDTVGDVVWAEARWDLAIVQIRPTRKLQALPFAPTDDLMVGEDVIAVGHPFGYSNTVSRGIISALKREITMPTGDVLTGLIQTDASINPGNSGGPLLNINGEFIGVVVALREGAQCIAFAINATTVKTVLRQNLSALRIAGVSHGLECKDKILAETGDRQRVVVAGFKGEGALQPGDEIVKVGAAHVVNSFDVERAFWDKKPGQHVSLSVVRGGQTLTVQLTLTPAHGAGQTVAVLPMNPATTQPTPTVSVPTADQQ